MILEEIDDSLSKGPYIVNAGELKTLLLNNIENINIIKDMIKNVRLCLKVVIVSNIFFTINTYIF